MAALTPVASTDAFLDALRQSKLLPLVAFTKVQAEAESTPDPKLLARQLIKAGTLTSWQANQLLYGRNSLVVGKYKLLDQVSSGATGRVYLAEHVQMNRRHLLKVLAKRYAADPAAVKRFMAQAQQACGLDHRNISHIYDVNEEDDWHFVVMEHVDGQDLQSLVEQHGPLPLAEALECVRQTVEGLHHAHAVGVVHGDLKPANLIREAGGTIKIVEIGQAGLTSAPGSHDARTADDVTAARETMAGAAAPTTTGASIEETGETPTLASAAFRAPEVIAGQPATQTSDVYSLGSILSFLLTGKTALNGTEASELLKAATGVPAVLAEICEKLMAERPEDRPQAALDAWNLIAAAEAAEGELPVTVAPEEAGTSVTAAASNKQKKLRMAQRLEPGGNGAGSDLTFQDGANGNHEESALAGLVINPRPREVKQPSEATALPRAKTVRRAVAVAQAAPLAEDGVPADDGFGALEPISEVSPLVRPAEGNSNMPLIIAGIAGGGVLVIGALAALVWMMASGKDGSQQSPQPGSQVAVVAQRPPATPVAPPPAPAPEANPTIGGETNPQFTYESSPTIPTPPPVEIKTTEAPTMPPATPAGTEPAKDEPKKDEPAPAPPVAKLEAKPDAKKDAKTDAKEPAKAKAAPPKAPPSPFRGFTAAVNLPPLPEGPGQQPGDALAALTLGPCKVPEKDPLEVTLKGGASAHRDRKLSYELSPVSGKPREWEFAVNGGDAPVTVATLSAKDDSLVFQWTEKAVEQPQPARYLSNCALELSSGMNQHRAALRMPIEGEPLAVEVDRRIDPLKWQVVDLPPAKQVFIEVVKCEGFEKLRVDPAQAVNLGEMITVWTGPGEKSPLLALRIETKASAKVMSVSFSPHVKLEGSNTTRLYSKKELATALTKTAQESAQLQKKMTTWRTPEGKPKPPKGVSTAEFNKQLDEYMKIKLPAEIANSESQLQQLGFLADFAKKASEAKIHFRVYHETEDGQLDLLKTYVDAPPKGKKK